MRVLDAIHENGAKLVELSPKATQALRAQQPGLRLVPVVYYQPALAPRPTIHQRPKAVANVPTLKTKLHVVSRTEVTPVTGATVLAFTDFANGTGVQGTTNAKGEVVLALGAGKIQRLYVYPKIGFWSTLKKNVPVAAELKVGLEPVRLTFTDALRHYYGEAADEVGAGVKVGVVDTGVDGTHPDLTVAGGENTVVGEAPADHGDNGMGHGTHVAGIVAARGRAPSGLRGLAPGVQLYSYRVFGRDGRGASNYAIAKAIDRAVAEGCDLLNLSLGGPQRDPATEAAIADARAQGVVVLAAAGNDERAPVAYPASDDLAVAVSALGRKGTFPKGAVEAGDVKAPFGKDAKNFVARFSNFGPEIALIGPGVGVLSTVPGGYAPMSGTSMACPAVTGVAARLLSAQPDLLRLSRDSARSDAIIQVVFRAASQLGLGTSYEGQGLPR